MEPFIKEYLLSHVEAPPEARRSSSNSRKTQGGKAHGDERVPKLK